MELISVIVPIYKVEAYLRECIDSIINQSYKNLEIILVDDGSPDGCPAICDEYANKDNRVKVIHQPNGGLSDARNAGLEVALGEYISFIDSDDHIAPEFFETLLTVLKETDADIAECGVSLVAEDGGIIKKRTCGTKAVYPTEEALYRLICEQDLYQTVWNKLYKKECVENLLFEKGKFHEDEFWTYKAFDRADFIAVCPDALYFYLQRSGSIMGDAYSLKRLDAILARFERMNYLKKYEKLYSLAVSKIYFDYMYHMQKALSELSEKEIEIACKTILSYSDKTDKPISVTAKERIWISLFRAFPLITAKIRNAFKIGI